MEAKFDDNERASCKVDGTWKRIETPIIDRHLLN